MYCIFVDTLHTLKLACKLVRLVVYELQADLSVDFPDNEISISRNI